MNAIIGQPEIQLVADAIASVLDGNGAEAVLQRVRQLIFELCRRYPVYGERGTISGEA
jgi:glycine/serine hydroxymethyltransferase